MAAKEGQRWASDKIRSPHDRFWSKVRKTSTCWLWEGAGSPRYGRFRPTSERARMVQAHHFSWSEENGPVPPGMFLLHACDVPNCVRPAHLRLGDQTENMHDVLLRGRRIGRGSRPVKLSPRDVRQIRIRLKQGETTKSLAAFYGVTVRPIQHIKANTKWAWLQ